MNQSGQGDTMSQDESKWTCSMCTFENWPKSIKCTICRSPKQSQIITQDKPQDIYMMAALISETSSPPAAQGSSASSNPHNKWSCPTCTYMNWPRSTKCTQCATKRKTSPPPEPSNNTSSHDQSNNVSTDSTTACVLSDNYYNDRNKSWSRSIKWTCSTCTYENWPKSIKCVLCHTPRPKVDQSCQTLAENDDSRSRQRVNRCDVQSSLYSSVNCLTIRRNDHLPSETTEIQVSTPLACASDISRTPNNYIEECRLRNSRRNNREVDWTWLNACIGVVDGDAEPVIEYLSVGGDPGRQLNANEVALLKRPSAFDAGYTLVHLAIRFQREDLLTLLLSHTEMTRPAAKRVPADISRTLASDIRHMIAASLKQRRGEFPCYFVTECVTFSLPAEIEDFNPIVQEKLFDDLLDRDAQKELEEESPIINWSLELTERLGSRLYALWNRSAGDCLLDSALQATWGVFDRDNTLRRALGESLCEAAAVLYPRWKEAETLQANLLQFTLDDTQWQEDWAMLLSLASQPGSALEQMHIFTLAHILRRPIIVYGVKYVKSFRGEALGYARFEGIYLPLLWEPTFCWKSPIALGYTRGHFTALVAMEPDSEDTLGAGANTRTGDDLRVIFLPLMTMDHQRLPVHFLTQEELGREEEIMKQWLDCCVTEGGILVAQQKILKRPYLVAQMIEEWLAFYRGLMRRPTIHHSSPESHTQVYSSDGDSDQE
ncbi:Ubiquitin thioesterase Zranb1 like protein [Argiope bruennichi]|uniref:ubiquitinyl hydrolase 1 n=1 Tax=Argiope bruennichi TaxID=94029 RepID=A0A8T0E771_ARGBR|nr:Ubiquitin thioesterase Zranb1 like protein [Argiope bruennichi]